MKALLYLQKRLFINNMKKTLKRPLVWIFTAFIIYSLFNSVTRYGEILSAVGLNSSAKFSLIFMLAELYLGVPALLSYIKRKGILFRKSDVQFIFPTPANPKLFLIMAYLRSFFVTGIILAYITVIGSIIFSDSVWKFIGYAIVYYFLSLAIDMSLIILCYGNEVLPEGFFKFLRVLGYGVMSAVVIGFIVVGMQEGFSADKLLSYLELPIIKMIPIYGWGMSLVQLFFIGSSWSNILGSVLFFAAAIILPIIAYRSPCRGEYFEDALKFASEYEIAQAKSKKGEVAIVGYKKKYKSANIVYRGYFSRAIFYKQLLEYKKSRYFIFGFRSFLFLAIGVGIIITATVIGGFKDVTDKIWILPGIMAYLTFIMSGSRSKWMEELENPYTFLIPDTKIRKTWNATKLEHIRAMIDASLLVVLGGIGLGINIVQIILLIICYVSLNSIRIYYNMAVDTLLGPKLGQSRNLIGLIKMGVFAIFVGISILLIVLGSLLMGAELGFFLMILFNIFAALFGFFLSSFAFERMEISE